MTHLECDVLVVGAGPAGLSTAVMAARHGARVLLVERRPGLSPYPRATGVSTRTVEILRTWGLEKAVRAGAVDVEPVVANRRTLADPPLQTVPLGHPTAAQAQPVSPATPLCCPQDHMERVLLAHLRERGVPVRFGSALIACDQDADGCPPRSPTARSCDRATLWARTEPTAPCAGCSGSAWSGSVDRGGGRRARPRSRARRKQMRRIP